MAGVPPIFSKSSDFQKNFASLKNFGIFAAGKDKGFEFCWKFLELGPPPQSLGATTLLLVCNLKR